MAMPLTLEPVPSERSDLHIYLSGSGGRCYMFTLCLRSKSPRFKLVMCILDREAVPSALHPLICPIASRHVDHGVEKLASLPGHK